MALQGRLRDVRCGLRCPYPRPEDSRRARFPRRHRSKRPLPENPGGRPPPHTIPPLRPVPWRHCRPLHPNQIAQQGARLMETPPTRGCEVETSGGLPALRPLDPHIPHPPPQPGQRTAPRLTRAPQRWDPSYREPARVADHLKLTQRDRSPFEAVRPVVHRWSPNQPPTWSLPRQRLALWADGDRLRSDPAALAAPEAVTHPITRPGSGFANHIAQRGSPARTGGLTQTGTPHLAGIAL